MNHSMSTFFRIFVRFGLFMLIGSASVLAGELEPGRVLEIDFAEADLPPSLYTMVTGTAVPPILKFRLPDNYDTEKTFPLLVYVPGNHGGPSGNISNAQTIAGPKDWVVTSLPLFKNFLDRDEIGGGIIVGFEDYATISQAYTFMLGKLFEMVPNIHSERSAMVGFSNGALTVAVLVSNHDEFILSHFKSFCLVDHGMFHLTDLHKKRSRNSRFLILSGDDHADLGRDLKTRGGRLLEDTWKLVDVDLSFHVMKGTGHEFGERQMAMVGRWLRHEPLAEFEVITPWD